MGATNHGTQSINFSYFLEATGANFGKQMLNILPPGIYNGGYLTKVSNSEVTLSTFDAAISDGSNQISVHTAAAATLNSSTLNSGAISSATPYLVLRWAYEALVTNYVDIHAIASLSAKQQNDVVIGKCVFVGSTLSSFDYSERTFPGMLSRCLSVEATPDTELYVRVRGGIVNTGTAKVVVGDQKVGPFTAPSSPNSRIDLVYVDADGDIQIQQGTAAVSPSAPSYANKLVLAEVRLVNGDTNITWDRITDARAFLAYPQQSTNNFIESTGTNDVSYSTAAWATIPNMTLNITTTGGLVHIVGSVNMYWPGGGYYNDFRLRINGSVQFTRELETGDDQGMIEWNINFYANLSAGTHTIDLQWYRSQANITQSGSIYKRYLQAVELK